MARPKIPIDEKLVYDWARVGCSAVIIGDYLGCDSDVINRRYGKILKKARAEFLHDILHAQAETALKGSATMLKWLGQQHCQQSEVVKVEQAQKQEILLEWSAPTENSSPATASSPTGSPPIESPDTGSSGG
jgi:hypothetical protein